MTVPACVVTFLGTSAAVPSISRDTTSLCLTGPKAAILVDCGGSPAHKLRRLGVDPLRLTAVVITHTHPDHAYGLPSLVQSLILLGRTWPLPIYCREEHAETLRALLDLFRLFDRGCPVEIIGVKAREGERLFVTEEFIVTASPNAHGGMPNLSIRVDAPALGRAAVYSSDTEPTDAVIRLARGVHTLIHEATFPHSERVRAQGHSTARQAGEVAEAAGVSRLILTHIDWGLYAGAEAVIAEAQTAFGGEVLIAEELHPYPL